METPSKAFIKRCASERTLNEKKTCVFRLVLLLGTHSIWALFSAPKQICYKWCVRVVIHSARSNQYGVKSACFRLFQFHLFSSHLIFALSFALFCSNLLCHICPFVCVRWYSFFAHFYVLSFIFSIRFITFCVLIILSNWCIFTNSIQNVACEQNSRTSFYTN